MGATRSGIKQFETSILLGDVTCIAEEGTKDCEDPLDLLDTLNKYIVFVRNKLSQFLQKRRYLFYIEEMSIFPLDPNTTAVLRRVLQLYAQLASTCGAQKLKTFYEELAKSLKTTALKPATKWLYALDRVVDYSFELKACLAEKLKRESKEGEEEEPW
ncbi:MAG TPA: hypothetical protein EYP32_05510 [Aquificaceae bacterium]|nr:hypothetical protein [Aquificaceae bacterium]